LQKHALSLSLLCRSAFRPLSAPCVEWAVLNEDGTLQTVKTNECCIAAFPKAAAQLALKQVLVTMAAMRPASDIWLGEWR